MILDVLKFPDKRLRDVSVPVATGEIASKSFQRLINDMFDTMYAAPGVGLAAVQIGVLKRVMTLDVRLEVEGEMQRDPHVLINPEIVKQEGKIEWNEGCLSCPELEVIVERSEKVEVRALDRDGKPLIIKGDGLLAIALQHEIDHMNGRLILDYLSRLKRDIYRKERVKAQTIVR